MQSPCGQSKAGHTLSRFNLVPDETAESCLVGGPAYPNPYNKSLFFNQVCQRSLVEIFLSEQQLSSNQPLFRYPESYHWWISEYNIPAGGLSIELFSVDREISFFRSALSLNKINLCMTNLKQATSKKEAFWYK